MVADDADLGIVRDLAFEHIAARDENFRELHDLTDLDLAADDFFVFRRKQAGHGRLDVVQRVVNDLIGADVDLLGVRRPARVGVGAHVERDDQRVGRSRQHDVGLADRADAGMHDADAHFLVLVQREQRSRQRLDGALHVGLDDDVQVLDMALLNLMEQIVEGDLLGLHQLRALLLDALLRNGADELLVQCRQLVAGLRHVGKSEHLDRHGRRRFLDVLAAVVDHRADLAVGRARDDGIADAECAVLHQHRRHRAAPFVELRLDDDAAGVAVRVRLQLLHFGDEQDRLQQVVDADLFFRGNRNHDDVAAPFLRHQLMLGQLLLDVVRVRARFVDLVDCDDDRHVRRFRVIDCLDGLRHHAVVRSDDENRDIRDLRAARAHRRESLMARRVEEHDFLALAVDLISADVLGNAAGLTARHRALANHIEQRRLAVVDVSHDRDHRRTKHQRLRVVLDDRDFRQIDLRRQCLDGHAELAGNQLRRVVVDFLIDRGH